MRELDQFTYEDWDAEEDRVIPYPTREAFLVARKIMGADHSGPLHIVVADGNVEDQHIDACFAEASVFERILLIELRALSVPQRYAAWHYAAYGQLNEPGTATQ